MVAIRIEISDYQSFKTTIRTFSATKNPSPTDPYNVSFKYIATILNESYEIKILISLSSPS